MTQTKVRWFQVARDEFIRCFSEKAGKHLTEAHANFEQPPKYCYYWSSNTGY